MTHPEHQLEIDLGHLRLAALTWGDPASSLKILALHGWLDNAASFSLLGPLLAEQGAYVVAVDMPGHGLSGHLPPGMLYHLQEGPVWLDALIEELAWPEVIILGHSLGGVFGVLYAAAGAHFQKLILLDSLGPMSSPEKLAPDHLQKAMLRVRKSRHSPSPMPVYDSIDEAAQRRTQGFGGLSLSSAHILVARNLKERAPGEWMWRTDPRLRWPSPIRFSESQVLACLESVSVPVHLVFGDEGFFVAPSAALASIVEGRTRALHTALGEGLQTDIVAGPHHLQLDGAVTELSHCLMRRL